VSERPTPEQLVAIINTALRAGDMKAVDAALRLLAVYAPRVAQDVLDTIDLGINLRETP
jgi:hypothetical protein